MGRPSTRPVAQHVPMEWASSMGFSRFDAHLKAKRCSRPHVRVMSALSYSL